MVFNLKNKIGKKLLPIFLIFTIFTGSFLPVFAPRAQAIFGIGDIVVDIKALIRSVIDGIAMNLAQRMVDDMVKSTVTWANTGFEGKPAFVTDPRSYFTNIADATAGEFINGSDLGFLCSPFQQNIRLSLRSYYTQSTGVSYAPSCTITGIKGNIEDFYRDFSQGGGWDTWFSITQEDNNNPYGAYINASIELDRRIASKLGIEKNKIDWGSGFKTKGECKLYNPTSDQVNEALKKGQVLPSLPGYGPGECVKYDNDNTPGVVIKEQLNKVLPSGLEKLITVEHVEQLVNAFTQGLLTRFVFGPKGLFGPDYADTYNLDQLPTFWGPTISTEWVYCANEGELCEFEGTREVRYGNGSSFTTGTFTDNVKCLPGEFNTSATGVRNWCEYALQITTTPPTEECRNGEVGSGNGSTDCLNPPTEAPTGTLRCVASENEVEIGNTVTWTLEGDDVRWPSTYKWSGEGVDGQTNSTASATFTSIGIKRPTVEVNTTNTDAGPIKTVNCQSVHIYEDASMQVSCLPKDANQGGYAKDVAYAPLGATTGWTATISGGSGSGYTLIWDGDENTFSNGTSAWTVFQAPQVNDPATNTTTVTQLRTYETPRNKYASVLVSDKDLKYKSAYSPCNGYILIGG